MTAGNRHNAAVESAARITDVGQAFAALPWLLRRYPTGATVVTLLSRPPGEIVDAVDQPLAVLATSDTDVVAAAARGWAAAQAMVLAVADHAEAGAAITRADAVCGRLSSEGVPVVAAAYTSRVKRGELWLNLQRGGEPGGRIAALWPALGPVTVDLEAWS